MPNEIRGKYAFLSGTIPNLFFDQLNFYQTILHNQISTLDLWWHCEQCSTIDACNLFLSGSGTRLKEWKQCECSRQKQATSSTRLTRMLKEYSSNWKTCPPTSSTKTRKVRTVVFLKSFAFLSSVMCIWLWGGEVTEPESFWLQDALFNQTVNIKQPIKQIYKLPSLYSIDYSTD